MTDTVRGSAPADPAVEPSPGPAPRPRRRRRVSANAVLIVFALALLTPWVLGRGLGIGENRDKTAFPKLSAAALVDQSTFRTVDAALRDRLPLRAVVIRAVGTFGTKVLHRSLTPLVVMTPGSQPFLSEDFTMPCRPFDATVAGRRIDALSAAATKAGKSVAVFIAPDKSTVFRTDLGSRADELLACADPIRVATQARWGGNPAGVVVPLFDQMAAAEKAAPDTTYQYGDSHWLPAGARVLSASMVQWFEASGLVPAGTWQASDIVVAPPKNAGGDLFRLMGAPRTDPVRDEKSVRPGVTTVEKRTPGLGAETYDYRSTSMGTPLVPGHTVIVRDSFFWRAMPQLAPYFGHVTVMHWAEFEKEARAGTLPSADHYVFETVQRGWPQRAMDVLSSAKVGAAVEKSLSAG